MADYNKVGLLAIRDNRLLLCRKRRGTTLLILPGGCLEANESDEECLRREASEELGPVCLGPLEYIGSYRDAAAGDPFKTVQIALYRADLIGTPVPNSEIAELIWAGPEEDRSLFSPSIANKILPDLIARRILEWPLQSREKNTLRNAPAANEVHHQGDHRDDQQEVDQPARHMKHRKS